MNIDTPQGTDEGQAAPDPIAAIGELLDDDSLDENNDAPEVHDEADEEGDEPELEAGEQDEDSDDDLDLELDESEDEDNADGEGENQSEAGRFVQHDGKVRLPDGTVTTVGDLAKGNLRQSDYSRKTQELAEQRAKFQQQESEQAQRTAQFDQWLEYAHRMNEAMQPQRPDKSMLETDPLGYERAKADWEEYAERSQVIQHMDAQRKHEESQKARENEAQRVQQEEAIVIQEFPDLTTPQGQSKFREKVLSFAPEKYGLTVQDLQRFSTDHRFIRILKDLSRLHDAEQGRKKVRQKMKGKPPMKGGRRRDPKSVKAVNREKQMKRLRSTGSLRDAASAFENMDI